MMSTLTDAELLGAYSFRRDEAAFGELMKRHGTLVYRTCLRLLKDPHEAEDASQAVFVVLARKSGKLRKGDLSAWLYRVAHHVATEIARKRMRRNSRETRYAETEAIQAEGTACGDIADPAIMGLLDAALLALPARYREAVVLRYLQNHSQQDAARLAGCPLGTMKRRASEGVARLRAGLAKRGVATSATAVAGMLAAEASAAIPGTLFPSVLQAVCTATATTAAATGLSAAALGAAAGTPGGAIALAEGVIRMMFMAKVKTAAICVAVVVVAGSSVPIGMAVARAARDDAGPTTPHGQTNTNSPQSAEGIVLPSPGESEVSAAVASALNWLALHQEADGSWSTKKWNDEDIGYEAAQVIRVDEKGPNVAATALALLAFMADGQTIRRGEYRGNITRGFDWLLTQQDAETGQLSASKYLNMYEHAIGTIALCEGAGRSPDERIDAAAQRAVDFCCKTVGKDHGWRYTPDPPGGDMSVTSWFMQALKTAKMANIKFDHELLAQAMAFVDQCTDKDGMPGSTGGVGYRSKPGGRYGYASKALTCAAMFIRRSNGMGAESPLLEAAAGLTRMNAPDWNQKDFYYWYYATHAMHSMGGEHRIWWNRRMRQVLLENQSRRSHQAGSWSPAGAQYGAHGGRVYTTAMGALCLAVDRRYADSLQSFGPAHGPAAASPVRAENGALLAPVPPAPGATVSEAPAGPAAQPDAGVGSRDNSAARQMDGWRHITKKNQPLLPGDEIQFIKVGVPGEDVVRVGTLSGAVEVLDGVLRPLEATKGMRVWDITERPEGGLWVGHGDGALLVDGDRTVTTLKGYAVSSIRKVGNQMWAIRKDQARDINSMMQADGEKWRPVPGLTGTNVLDLVEDSRGTIWVVLDGNGVMALPRGQTVKGAVHHLPRLNVTGILTDSQGSTWCGMMSGGVMVLQNGKWHSNLTEERSAVLALVEDGAGKIWAATSGNGLHVFDGKSWTHMLEEEGAVTLLKVTSDKRVWVGTQRRGGLQYWDGAGWKVSLAGGLPIRCLAELPDGTLMAGGVLDGLYIRPGRSGR